MPEKYPSLRGLLLTILISSLGLFYFFSEALQHPNSTYFSTEGDGLQIYYATAYHALHDTSYFNQQSINYPYGENILLTACQPSVSNPIKMFAPIVDLSGYTTGITNLIMLLSVVLCAVFIFLILKHFEVNWIYASVAATCVSFLSPQLHRMGGHYTLTYQFAIPAFIYLLLKFYERPSLFKSTCIGLLILWLAANHLYFLGFFAFIAVPVFIFSFLKKREGFQKLLPISLHFLIQMVLPYLLLNIIARAGDHPNDRTHLPWGFLDYSSNLTGIFFPFGKPYEPFIRSFWKPKNIEWEGVSYIGLIAIAGVFYSLFAAIKKIKNKTFSLAVNESSFLNIIFWSSFVALLYSFGIPFLWGLQSWIKKLGIIAQMRGIARFSWLFYYSINIITIITFYALLKNKGLLKHILMIFICAVLSMDAYCHALRIVDVIINKAPELEDSKNQLPQNNWMNTIDIKKYQAILSLPYFHTGSENIWIEPKGETAKHSFIISLKTGLPLLANSSSRSSLSETYKHVELILEPPEYLEILNDIRDKRPLLVMAENTGLSEEEQNIIRHCTFLSDAGNYKIYSLELYEFKNISTEKINEISTEIKTKHLFKVGGFLSNDSVKKFFHLSYDSLNNNSYRGTGSLQGKAGSYTTVYDGAIPYLQTDSILVFSFWMKDFKKDIYPRSAIETAVSSNNNVNETNYLQPFRILKRLDGNWALIEGTIHIKPQSDKLKITIWNNDLSAEDEIIIDEFFLRSLGQDLYMSSGNMLFKNNRYYRSMVR